ncbi:MAG: 3-oxoacyl-ACP reductase FabG [bacterium]
METRNNFNSVVTGGCGGIGKSIVEKLISRGDNVFILDCLNSDSETVKYFKSKNVYYFQVDLASVESIKNVFANIFEIINSKNESLNLLVNAAGVAKDNLAIRMTESEWDSVLDVNLKGTFFCCQQAIKHMMKNKKGYIINFSSVVADSGNPGQINYAASKSGIIALTKTLAQEYGARNILINAIAPGFIDAGMTKNLSEKIKEFALGRISLKRFGTPDDIANLVDFLSSGKADYITGQVININGGMF